MKWLSLDKVKESEIVELKPSLSQVNEIVEAISAFSNTVGGKIIIGVSSSGKLLGVEVGKDTIEKLTNQIHQGLDPKVHPRITTERIDKKNIVVIEVKQSTDKLTLAFGRPFKRVAKSTVRMSKDEYERMILEKHKDKLQFDKRICKGASLDDIDTKLIKDFLKRAKSERRLELDPQLSTVDALKRLNLIEKGKLINAALLLFGKNPQKFILQAEVRCARFKGVEPIEFIDMKVFGKNIIDQREDALEFVKEHIRLHAEIKGTERVERWEYPIEALREAITNAICHRDYGIQGSIQVRIFDDRIEVWGCGPLPDPLTPQDLKKKHRSILRNPLIGRCLFLIKYIEEWGTGTNRMIEQCLKHGLPEPVFEEVAESFVVTFRKEITVDFLREKGLSERQIKAVFYVREKHSITNKEYCELNNVSKRTATNELKELIEKEIFKQTGKGKRGLRYILR